MMSPIDIMFRQVMSAWAPPPNMTITEWAEKHRRLSQESSAIPGRFDMGRTEYFREPLDMVGKPGVKRITLMTSAQVGKTTFVENIIGYFIHYDPCPILHVSPTLSSMKMFSKERLAPMIRDTPVLTNIVKEARSRDSGNTIDSKTFPGGHIAMVGSNAPAGLASRPIRVALFDEVDRFERSAGAEGDPISLAVKRTTNYWNRVLVFASTPGVKGHSRIEKEFLDGDQRYMWAKCVHCDEHQVLKWSSVKWDSGHPDTARYECEHCGTLWDDVDRYEAVRRGEWRATQPFNGNLSYHLSQLYSQRAPLSDAVREFLVAKSDPALLQVWVNTVLGETWEEKGQRLDWSDLMEQREEYELRDPIPADVTLITAGVDMQDDRAEIEWVGWGDDHRSWSLGYRKVYGDPSASPFWVELRANLSESFVHPVFGEMAPRFIAIDSGGHYTHSVYAFAASTPRVVAVKGIAGAGKPIVTGKLKNTINNSEAYGLGVDTIKELVATRLRQRDSAGAGYCVFHHTYGDEYFRGLTAEELRTKHVKGFKVQEWHKLRPRNEPFDCRVYATGALEMLNVDLNAQRRAMLQALVPRVTPVAKAPRPRINWATGFRDE